MMCLSIGIVIAVMIIMTIIKEVVDMSKIICRCEEITEEEILQAIKDGATTVDEVKKFTRAGMGLCQGRTCRRTVEKILARELKKSVEEIKSSSYRMPVRPVKMKVFERKDV